MARLPAHPVLIGAVLGFLAVALGAFGAHALKDTFGPDETQWWHTAVQYQFWHALLLVGIGVLPARRLHTAAALCAAAGVVLFSGSLYAMALTGVRILGAVTPLGGLAFLAAWALVGVAAIRPRSPG